MIVAAALSAVAGLTGIGGALTAIPFAKRVFGFFGSPAGKVAGMALLATLALGYAFHRGSASANGQCQAAALQAKLDAAIVDRDTANARAERSADLLATLDRQRDANAQEIDRLTRTIAKLSLQSTQPGAKHDPNALLNDRCEYTERGAARGVRKQPAGRAAARP